MIRPPNDSANLRLGRFSSTTGHSKPDGRNLRDAHATTAATASRPYPCLCADCLIHSPVSSKSASAECKPAKPRNSPVDDNLTVRLRSSPAAMRANRPSRMRSNSSREAGGFHDMKRAIAALPSEKASSSAAVNDFRIIRGDEIDTWERSPDSCMISPSLNELGG